MATGHSRNLESFFTNGYISEAEYRQKLDQVLKGVVARIDGPIDDGIDDKLMLRVLMIERDGVTHTVKAGEQGGAFLEMETLLHPPEYATGSIRMPQWQGAREGERYYINTPEISGECVILRVDSIKRGEVLVHLKATGQPNPDGFTRKYAPAPIW